MCLSRATRPAWYSAAAGLICGSSPLPDAVARSTGIGEALSGSAALSASTRPLTASISAGFVGPKFDPPEAAPLFGIGDVAESRPQKIFRSLNYFPINQSPPAFAARITKLPDTRSREPAFPVTRNAQGFTEPVQTCD